MTQVNNGGNNITGDGTNLWSYSTTVPNELVQIKPLTTAALYTFAYDQHGNTSTIGYPSTSTQSTQLTYDPQARLSTVTLKDGTLIKVGYNARGSGRATA